MWRTEILYTAAALLLFTPDALESVYQEPECVALDGQCVNTGWGCCHSSAYYVSNKCPNQPGNVKCCTKLKPIGGYAEIECTSQGGQCMTSSSSCCTSGNFISGACPDQPAGIKCCLPEMPSSAASCRLMDYTYSGTQFYHASQTKARIDQDFQGVMDTLNGYASSCNVKIYVTSSFRANPVQATQSCHMVGHAIDMNVLDVSTGQLCTMGSGCLQSYYPSGPNDPVNCFLQLVKANSALRWGASFTPVDPVHIDDGTCTNTAQWTEIRNEIVDNCPDDF